MLDSIIADGDGISLSGAATSQIELGIFQEALRQAINANISQAREWSSYLQRSVASSAVTAFTNVTMDVDEPLDRLSIGRSLVVEQHQNPNASTLAEIKALEQSVLQQPRNANGGLWYYDNVNNLTAYANLSYLDGMFSYAPFTTLLPSILPTLNATTAFDQVQTQLDILYQRCYQNDTGLLVHGYDAAKTHPWASPVTGASPIVWSRSLGWYTVGLVDSLAIAMHLYSQERTKGLSFNLLRQRFNELVRAQVEAVNASANATGRNALWQVVTEPGAQGNFVESSGTALVAYALAKGVRTGLLLDKALKQSAASTATKMVEDLVQHFVLENANGTLSFNGTSSVASLSGKQIDFEVSNSSLRKSEDES
ncbi:MAG: hypothetical protein M1822_000273 [Bathelium mastoideum]|nr:MAG: hypothetical protein M1822_000273 [Bathelium mastoideum]